YSIPEISAMVVRHLKELAEAQLGQMVHQAVVTVPANFTDSQRQATKRAGELAGLEVLRILNEPTAAALAYGFGRKLDGAIAIFDLGGGTFDATALQVSNSIFEVLATGGDPFLGGDDFDRVLVDTLASDLNRHYHVDPSQDPNALAKLRSAAEQIKMRLSEDDDCAGTIHDLTKGPDGRDVDLDFDISRAEFEQQIEPYVSQAVRKCREVLRAARVDASELADLILVGGSTRTPLVREMVEDEFDRAPQTGVNPDETVAYGAAVQAASLAGAEDTPGQVHALLLDVCPRALGIKVAGGYNEIIIPQNTPVPVERSRSFTTSKNGQETVVLQVSQGESRMFEDNEVLGVLTLDGIPPRPRGESKIEVTFNIDADGILSVSGRDQLTNNQTQATMKVVGAPAGEDAGELPPPASIDLDDAAIQLDPDEPIEL
ncbi:MAG: Hsp70 family protein, partial [Deltaproteobacteria bacterium]|nr:Hsp70 family protein [Deltaproteobacteria bacterium]